jgi:hypothetical protein
MWSLALTLVGRIGDPEKFSSPAAKPFFDSIGLTRSAGYRRKPSGSLGISGPASGARHRHCHRAAAKPFVPITPFVLDGGKPHSLVLLLSKADRHSAVGGCHPRQWWSSLSRICTLTASRPLLPNRNQRPTGKHEPASLRNCSPRRHGARLRHRRKRLKARAGRDGRTQGRSCGVLP